MKTHIWHIIYIIMLSSCSTWKQSIDNNNIKEIECVEIYGELTKSTIVITQDLVSCFCYDGIILLPKRDSIEISTPSKLNPDIVNLSPDTKAFYAYSNSASIWLSNKHNGLDYNELLQRIHKAVMRIQIGLEGEKFFVPETTITEGVDENGLCWKTVNFEFMSYGYSSVPPEHKWYFDKILRSFHKKTPSYEEVFEEIMKNM